MRSSLPWLLLAACSASFPEPTAFTVTPERVRADAESRLTITADHLDPQLTFDLDRPGQSRLDSTFGITLVGPTTVTLHDVAFVRSGVVQGYVPAGTTAGKYSVHLQQPQGTELVIVDALQVVASP